MGFPARVASFVFLGSIRVGIYTLEGGILVETLDRSTRVIDPSLYGELYSSTDFGLRFHFPDSMVTAEPCSGERGNQLPAEQTDQTLGERNIRSNGPHGLPLWIRALSKRFFPKRGQDLSHLDQCLSLEPSQ